MPLIMSAMRLAASLMSMHSLQMACPCRHSLTLRRRFMREYSHLVKGPDNGRIAKDFVGNLVRMLGGREECLKHAAELRKLQLETYRKLKLALTDVNSNRLNCRLDFPARQFCLLLLRATLPERRTRLCHFRLVVPHQLRYKRD